MFQVLCLIGFIACLPSGFGGGGFVIWVFITALITTIVLFVLKALNIWARFPDYRELYVSIRRKGKVFIQRIVHCVFMI